MLHGEIRINDEKIGEWWAVRQHGAIFETNLYSCGVRCNGVENKFEIAHRYEDGAVALASKILERAIVV